MPLGAASFAELDRMHEELDALFLRHQEHLVLFETVAARATLERFGSLLGLHLRQEEENLLPRYAGTPRGLGRDRPELYLLEHRKLEQLLGKLQAALAAVGEAPAPRQIIGLLERGLRFKHVLEHHGDRERAMLYPALDRRVSAESRRAIVAACFAEWRAFCASA